MNTPFVSKTGAFVLFRLGTGTRWEFWEHISVYRATISGTVTTACLRVFGGPWWDRWGILGGKYERFFTSDLLLLLLCLRCVKCAMW
jgi:hypothetical protein